MARLHISCKFRYLNEVVNKEDKGNAEDSQGLLWIPEKTGESELEPKLIYPEGLPGGSGMSVPCFFLFI